MRRGEIWTVSAALDYAGKPRPAVVVQEEFVDGFPSVTLCPFTSDPAGASRFRVPILPDPGNGLQAPSRLMVDKVTTVPATKIGKRIGVLSQADLARVERALLVFLGLAEYPTP